ncbi:MAG: manganese efflux pump, partial [Bacteroidales bacterium]|nr:manganese efflux pump [Bacteroidales bacterium]
SILLGTIAATPVLSLSIANAENVSRNRSDVVIRIALIIAFCLAVMTQAGHWAGKGLLGMLDPDQLWLTDTLWYVVGLKMIFVGFRREPNYKNIDLASTGSAILAGIASSMDALLIAMALGMEQATPGPFTVYTAGIGLIFVWLGSGILASVPFISRNHPRLLLVSGSILLAITALS